MTSSENPYFSSPEVGRLQVLAEEATRARPDAPESRFVSPEGGVIDTIGSRFHHVLYGRRGSGKSSLLRRIETTRREHGHLVAWTDQEVFMGLEYPDVLVSTLSAVLEQFSEQIRKGQTRQNVHRFVGIFKRRSISPHEQIAEELSRAAASLEQLKAAPSESEIEWISSSSLEASASRGRNRTARAGNKSLGGSVSSEDSRLATHKSGSGLYQKYRATKADHLERAIPTYRKLISLATSVAPDAFIVLDDFYRLAEKDQPLIAGYLHRVVKDTTVWLKIGSIQYWTHLYSGAISAGLQEPHDIRGLSLDQELRDFDNSRRFLERILLALAQEVEVDIERLLSDGAKKRLVLASGGVPRDYVGLLGEAIANAKSRGPTERSGSNRVIAEDVNKAAGRRVDMKFKDLEEDAGEAARSLRDLVLRITNHCRNTASSCFLVDFQEDHLLDEIKRLQNMRFVHEIETNETLPDPQSSRYDVFLLDVSLLVAQRAAQIDFMEWTKREKRRARKLVLRLGETDHEPAVEPTAEEAEPAQLQLLEE